jgi:hypothetical protein
MAKVRNSPDRPRPARRAARSGLWVFGLGCLLGGFLAAMRGQDNSYDLRYYHYYIPYALFADRIGFDYAPAQLQSYLNPLSFLPFYFLATHAPAVVVGILQGIAHGLVLGLAFAVARQVFGMMGVAGATRWALLSAALGMWGPIFLGLVGGSSNDILIAELVLAAILLVLRWWRAGGPAGERWWRGLATAGVVLGIAVGLKLTAALYAAVAAASLLVLPATWRQRARIAAAFVGALAVGFLLSAGWWMAVLQARFASPVFPFFNAVFRSPDYPPANVADKRFLPQGWGEHLTHPVRLVFGAHREGDNGYRDARYAMLAVLVVGVAGAAAVRFLRGRLRPHGPSPRPGPADLDPRARAAVRFLLCFVVIAYVLWQWQFAILRYASPLEVLAPLVMLVLVYRIAARPRVRRAAAVAVAVGIVASMRPFNVDRMPWFADYIHAEAPRFADPRRVLVVMAHNAPWSYVLPSLQPEIRVLGLRTNLTKPNDGTRFQAQMRDILSQHTGSIYLLSDAGYVRDDLVTVNTHYGLVPVDEPCLRIATRHQTIPIYLCPVRKAAS